jgi:hypothetical protein
LKPAHRFYVLCVLILACSSSHAQPWQFGQPIDVTSTAGSGIFHHLESAGRRNIAVSEDTVAIAWEDNHEGDPSIYLARKLTNKPAFDNAIRISGKGEAYEPAVVALTGNRFAIAWEEEGRAYVRIVSADMTGPAVMLSKNESAQVSLAASGESILVVFSERAGRYGRIRLQQLQIKNNLAQPVSGCHVDAIPPKADQLYPVAAVLGERTVVAWEDRRPGHTIIMAAQSKPAKTCEFSPPVRISERPPGPKMPYGAGHGVARVVLGNYGTTGLFAAWADKRNFQEGYDIYGADKQGSAAFSPNVRVQDDFGGEYRQWHSTVSGHADGKLAVAWTDERDASMDIWLSWLEDGQWSEDIPIAGASGPGEQAHPSILIDGQGNLHVAWIEREKVGGTTRLRYLSGELAR